MGKLLPVTLALLDVDGLRLPFQRASSERPIAVQARKSNLVKVEVASGSVNSHGVHLALLSIRVGVRDLDALSAGALVTGSPWGSDDTVVVGQHVDKLGVLLLRSTVSWASSETGV